MKILALKILAFAGSNASHSINQQLVTYACSLLQPKHQAHIMRITDYGAPIYSTDLEKAHGVPEAVMRFAVDIDAADALLIALPEHNGAYSAVFKNLFDWLSRVPNRNTWSKNETAKKIVLLSTSPGSLGGQSVLEIARERFPRNGGEVLAVFSLPHFADNFQQGTLINQDKQKELRTILTQALDT